MTALAEPEAPATSEPEDLEDGLAPEPVDPDAPHGRKPDGTPYKRPAEWRAKMTERMTAARWSNHTPRKTTGTRKPAGRNTGKAAPVDYAAGVAGLLQIPAFALAMLGRVNPAFSLDAATLTLHTPSVAAAVAETARQDERVAAILDRVLAAGPYGALLGALVPLGLQLAANHGKLAPNPDMGILAPEQLLAALDSQQAKR